MTKKRKARLVLVATAAAALSLGSVGAFAGEITGNGKDLKPLKGRSACAFSGRQDDAAADEGLFKNVQVQSWGQLFKPLKELFTEIGLHPGQACNPNRSGGEP